MRKQSTPSVPDPSSSILPALKITGHTLSKGDPLVVLAATVTISSAFTGKTEYMCSLTLDQRRRVSPSALTWDMSKIPAHYRRAIRHLVGDLADSLLSSDSNTTGKEEAR